MYNSPHKYLYNSNNNNNNNNNSHNNKDENSGDDTILNILKKEEYEELENYSATISNELMQLQNETYGEILSIFLWNSIGDGNKGYSECRKLINQAITRDIQHDLYITQEPAYSTTENYLKCFNLTSDKYEITYPPNSREQVAIIFNKTKLLIEDDGHKDTYKLIEESKKSNISNDDGIEYKTQFPIFGKSRVQIVHFKLYKASDSICIINIHSIYNNYTIEGKKNFILEFFKFVNWYICVKNKNNSSLKVLIAGDFNLDIIKEDISQLVYNEIGLILSIPTPPSIDLNYDEDEISKTNIDFFCTIYNNSNHINITQVSKLPIRYKNYYNDFPDIQKYIINNNVDISRISTHDPQFCYLIFNKIKNNSSGNSRNSSTKEKNICNESCNKLDPVSSLFENLTLNDKDSGTNTINNKQSNNQTINNLNNINNNNNNISSISNKRSVSNNSNNNNSNSDNKIYYLNFNFQNITLKCKKAIKNNDHCGFAINGIPIESLLGIELHQILNTRSHMSKTDSISIFIDKNRNLFNLIQDVRKGLIKHYEVENLIIINHPKKQ